MGSFEPFDERRIRADLSNLLRDAPLYLAWEHQGKIWWNDDWLKRYGPVRSRIPGFDDHVSFANFDLGQNALPLIRQTDVGRPYVSCQSPLTASEMERVNTLAAMLHSGDTQPDVEGYQKFMTEKVYDRLGITAGVRDVVRYHGFVPAKITPGLAHLGRLAPPRELRRRDS